MNEYQIAWIVGGVGGTLWVAAWAISWGCLHLWAWVHDTKAPKKNPIIRFIMLSILGWKESGEGDTWYYYKGESYSNRSHSNDGGTAWVLVLLFLLLAPTTTVLLYKAWGLVLTVLLIAASAHTARNNLRQRKKLDEHVADDKVHPR